jgi:predicted nucleic acid-binding protein
VIGADTSVIVRYLVGTPPGQAERAAVLVDGDAEIGVSLVALAETAHVLRTQYGVAQRDILDSLIDLVQRENVRIVDYGVPTRET